MAGRPKGSKNKENRENRLKKIAKRILEGKPGDGWKSDPNISQEEYQWRSLLEINIDKKTGEESAKSRETRLRALGMLSDRLRGKPSEFIEHSGSIKGGGSRIVILPEKRSSTEWEKKYGRKEEETKVN